MKDGDLIMALIKTDSYKTDSYEKNFLRELDRGIDDMETGRELPLEQAFQKISELRMKNLACVFQSYSHAGKELYDRTDRYN